MIFITVSNTQAFVIFGFVYPTMARKGRLRLKNTNKQAQHASNFSGSNGIRTQNHLVRKQTLNHLAKLAKRLICVVSTYMYGARGCVFLSCHMRVLEWSWSSSDCNGIRTQNQLARKRTLNHLAKLAKWDNN